MIASARLILNIHKYDHISAAMCDNLHWLPVSQQVRFKICLLVRYCLVDVAPAYLEEFCKPVSSVAGRQNLLSSVRCDSIW